MVYVPGLLTGQLSGLAGSTLASKNRYATFVTCNTMPAAGSSPARSQITASFGSIAGLFKTLTSSQLEDWNDLGAAITISGRLSRSYALTASAAFMLVNRNRATIGLAPVLNPPAYDTPEPIAGAAFSVIWI